MTIGEGQGATDGQVGRVPSGPGAIASGDGAASVSAHSGNAPIARLTPKQLIVYKAIECAANAGQACPSNPDLCDLVDAKSSSAPVGLIDGIVRAGLISVERFQVQRRVTIIATGKSTYVPPTAVPHWRSQRASERPTQPKLPRAYKTKSEYRPAQQVDLPRVHRDPCPRCGVRGDIGCAHSPNRLGTAFGA